MVRPGNYPLNVEGMKIEYSLTLYIEHAERLEEAQEDASEAMRKAVGTQAASAGCGARGYPGYSLRGYPRYGPGVRARSIGSRNTWKRRMKTLRKRRGRR